MIRRTRFAWRPGRPHGQIRLGSHRFGGGPRAANRRDQIRVGQAATMDAAGPPVRRLARDALPMGARAEGGLEKGCHWGAVQVAL